MLEESIVVHVVPNPAGVRCGIGDYAQAVGNRVEQLQLGVCRYFPAGILAIPEGSRLSGDWLWQRVAEIVGSQASRNCILVLHYSGYGFSCNGAPTWLARALEVRPVWASGVRIVTFFHEVYAFGWPWKTAFWLSGLQRSVATRIAKASHKVITNRHESAKWLEKASNRSAGTVSHLAVPSNVGEPSSVPSYSARPRQAVLFGGVRLKKRFLVGSEARNIIAACKCLGITSIVEIGSPVEVRSRIFADAGIRLSQAGYVSAQETSDYLGNSRIGFFDYHPDFVTKSSILSAYVSHGVCPVVTERTLQSAIAEYSISLREVAKLGIGNAELSKLHFRLERNSEVARNAYARHSIEKHVACLLEPSAQDCVPI